MKDYFVIPPNGAINCPGATSDLHKAVEIECDEVLFTTADPTFMIERNQSKEVNDPYAQGIHPISMEITDHWTTPLGEDKIEIGEELRKQLIQVIANDGSNIFIYPNDDPNAHAIREFEKISNKIIRDYITEAYGITNIDDLDIEARSFGNHQVYGGRTYPHYHHGFDGVLIYYLTAGNEYVLDDNRYPVDLDNNLKTSNTDGSGNLILQDPRPSQNYPYCNKALAWSPVTGTLLMHPACIWHESNTFTGSGIRVSIVINYRILTKTNSTIVKPLSTIYDENN